MAYYAAACWGKSLQVGEHNAVWKLGKQQTICTASYLKAFLCGCKVTEGTELGGGSAGKATSCCLCVPETGLYVDLQRSQAPLTALLMCFLVRDTASPPHSCWFHWV